MASKHLQQYPWFETARAKAPQRSVLRGCLTWLFGPPIVFAFGVGIPVGIGVLRGQSASAIWFVGLLFGAGALLVTALVIRHGWQQMLPNGFDVLKRDPRPPVLFLRSFFEDDRRARDDIEKDILQGNAGHESALKAAFRSVGPFLAIGKPDEDLHPIGASRLYVTEDAWQTVVLSLINSAAAVVLQPDGTPGTRWEIAQVAAHLDPRRLLILTPNPNLRPLGYRRVRASVAEYFRLPEAPGPCDAFVFEDGLWKPLSLDADAHLVVARHFIDRLPKAGTS